MAPLEGDFFDEGRSMSEEAHYEAHRSELMQLLKGGKGGRGCLEPRGEGGVGLLNQGATCYMNSLLQALYYIPEFRLLLYSWQYDAKVHGDAARSIPLQLQRLFAQLQLSRAGAISTRALTTAFGFSDMESREQHDVQELCRVLFDALGRSAPVLATEIDKLYSGQMFHYLRSREAAEDGTIFQSRREEKFLDLQVPIQDCTTLEEALRRLTEVEAMDGDNQWSCEDLGRKVDADKGVEFGRLPSIVCLQLLRFVFDLSTGRRRKLTEPLSIPVQLDLASVLGAKSSSAMYHLCTVCLHRGTAHGGHYHAYIRDAAIEEGCGAWRDANDAHVKIIGAEEEKTLFQPRAAHLADGSVCEGGGVCALSSSDAYFLIYRRIDQQASVVSDDLVPEPHRSEIGEENLRLCALQEAYRVHRQLLELKVYAPTAQQLAIRRHATKQLRGLLGEDEEEVLKSIRGQPSVTLSVRDTSLVSEVRKRAVEAFLDEAEKGGEPWPWAMRIGDCSASVELLRQYDPSIGEAKAFLQEGMPIGEALRTGDSPIGGGPSALLLDVHTFGSDIQTWSKDDFRVIVCRWDPARSGVGVGPRDVVALHLPAQHAASSTSSANAASERGEGEEDRAGPTGWAEEAASDASPAVEARPRAAPSPTIGAIRRAAARAFGASDADGFALVAMTGAHAGEILSDDSQTLLQILQDGHGRCGAGDVFCVEFVSSADAVVQCAELYQRVKNTAHINFNHPDRPQYTEEFQVAISKDATLLQLKAKISESIGMQVDTFHLAKAPKMPQLKEESKTLRAVGLVDGGSCFVGHGAPCGVDEFMLRVAFYTRDKNGGAKVRDVCSHPAKGSASVRSLREALVEPMARWASEASSADGDPPFPAEGLQWRRLRIRDGQAGKQFAILRDERTLRSALLGLGDGRQIAVQVLDHDEELTSDDMILQLRPWRYKAGKLHAPTEWIARKTRTLVELRAELTEKFKGMLNNVDVDSTEEQATDAADSVEEEDKLQIVALATAGPPLTIKRCSMLKWEESQLNGSAEEDLHRPLVDFKDVRDGATLVIRSALEASRGPPGEPPAKGAGKGPSAPAAKVGATKAKAAAKKGPSSVLVGAPRRERALIIEVAHPEGGPAAPGPDGGSSSAEAAGEDETS